MLIAVKVQNKITQIYHWSPGGCAKLNGGGWLGWATPNACSHPAQSENEFVHKCLTDPREYFIQADETGILIKENDKVILEQGN